MFDQPSRHLNPALFTAEESMLPAVRKYIFDDINKILTPGMVVGVYLLGSMAGRQYGDTSDIDINLVLKQNLNRNDHKEHVRKYNERMLPGTTHPVNYHVQDYSEASYEGNSEYAVYDLLRDAWAVPPKAYEKIRDPQEEFRDEIRYSKLKATTLKYNHNKQLLHDRLEKGRKTAYSTGWGTPRESQQNILYKYIESILNQNKK